MYGDRLCALPFIIHAVICKISPVRNFVYVAYGADSLIRNKHLLALRDGDSGRSGCWRRKSSENSKKDRGEYC